VKRSGPPDRRAPLRADPAKTRAWQDRHRKPIASSELVPTRQRNAKNKPVVLPPDVRRAARARSEGKCVVCLHRGRRGRSLGKAVHLHHVLPKGLDRFKRWATESANLIGLCFDCHMAHENASRRVPWEALPDVTVNLIARVGPVAVDYCAAVYPRGTE
jgi:5-methylcytosine-specific restriction endonuclease McrA